MGLQLGVALLECVWSLLSQIACFQNPYLYLSCFKVKCGHSHRAAVSTYSQNQTLRNIGRRVWGGVEVYQVECMKFGSYHITRSP